MPFYMSKTYHRIEKAVGYMVDQQSMKPSTEKLAELVNLNIDEFRQMFTKWSGVDPETFSRRLWPQLRKSPDKDVPDLFDSTRTETPAGSAWHHSRFVNINRMAPDDYQNGAKPLEIAYSVQLSPFGRMMVASTDRGICAVWFLSEDEHPHDVLAGLFPKAHVRDEETPGHLRVAGVFGKDKLKKIAVDLHVKGTPFQVSVWEALLRIPAGELRCCSDLAREIDNPKAVRAVGSAIGSNPIAFFIPCHRVVPAAGGFGNYRWGKTRKAAMIGWEKAQNVPATKKQFK